MKRFVTSLVFLLSGCALIPRRVQAPSAQITLPSGAQLGQSGDAQKPATVATSVITSTLPIPAASSVILDEKKPGIVTFQLAEQSELKTETRTEKAEAPQAFTPPAPPSPTEIAAGRSHMWFQLGLALGFAASLFGLVRGWDLVMYGGGAVAAACGFALFAQAHPILIGIIGAGAALAVAGPALWHLKLKHLEPPAP